MPLGQKQNGTTVNASISVNANSQYVYTFADPYDMLINLSNVSGIVAADGNSPDENSQFLLGNSSGNTINGNDGNDTYVVAATSVDLGGNVLHGGKGVDVVQLSGSGATVDLTQGSSGVEAVVAKKGLIGETVDLKLSQLAGSALTNGGAGPGKAFAALVGSTGTVNIMETGHLVLTGILNAAGVGFAADGTRLGAAATTALAAQTTRLDDVLGSLATTYAGGSTAPKLAAVANALNAYVFSDGVTSYTVWTDGAVTATDNKGNVLPTAYQPAPSAATAAVFGTITQFTKSGSWATGVLGINPAGLTTLHLTDGSSLAYAAIQLNGGVSGTVVTGDTGANGGDWIGLGKSGGNNIINGSKQGDIYDLQSATSLMDILRGSGGFDVVRAKADGTDVDLTAGNTTTGKAAASVDGVVGAATTTTTVEVNIGALAVATDATGAKTSAFEALLGSSADTLTLSGAGRWKNLGSFNPGDPLPTHATTLAGGAILDALYNGGPTHTAENSLVGTLYEQVSGTGAAVKYVTVYTDATVVSTLLSPPAALLAQSIAQLGSSGAANLTQGGLAALSAKPVLAASHV